MKIIVTKDVISLLINKANQGEVDAIERLNEYNSMEKVDKGPYFVLTEKEQDNQKKE